MRILAVVSLWICFFSYSSTVFAQSEVNIGQIHTYASTKEQAFWLTRNDLGLLRDTGNNLLNFVEVQQPLLSSSRLKIEAGGLLSWNSFRSTQAWLPQLWLKASLSGFDLEIGRFNMQWENPTNPNLSSGDLRFGLSSTPMPMIRVQNTEWKSPIPFFKEFQVKGMLMHGWLEDNRTVENAFVHAKSGQFSLDFDGFRPRFGITHLVQWGGVTNNGVELPDGIDNFLRIFRGQRGNESAPSAEQSNVLGNHLGTWDMGFDWKTPEFSASFIWHHLFEDGSGQRMRNGSDGMLRVSLKKTVQEKEYPFITEFVFEHINTTNASGWGSRDGPDLSVLFDEFGYRHGGRDPYYTHYIYQNGWTYLGQPMHHPFFMTRSEGLRWAPSNQEVVGGPTQERVSTQSFVSSSILAHHIAWGGWLPQWVPGNWKYIQRTSIVRYYGNMDVLPLYFAPFRANDSISSSQYAFYPDIVQYYTAIDLEKTWQWNERVIQTTFSVAMDRGEWHRTFGFGLEFRVSL